MSRKKKEPVDYRPCVGVALFNRAGLVWIGRRVEAPDDAEGAGDWWQMPQGGLDDGEEPLEGALRELFEETSIRTVSRLGETTGWLTYDLPAHLIGKAWGGRYRGQKQKWFALRFEGDEDEIDVARPGGGKHKAEFGGWRWETLERVPALVVAFKRPVYDEVVKAFAPYGKKT